MLLYGNKKKRTKGYRHPLKHQRTTEIYVWATSFVLFLCFGALSPRGFAAESANALTLGESHHAGAVDRYLVDLGKHYDNEPPINVPANPNSENFGTDNQKSQWYKLSITHLNAYDKEWFIATALSQAPLLQVFKKTDKGFESIFYQDGQSRFHDRPYPHRVLIVPVKLKPHENIELYIQYKAIANYPIFPVVLDLDALVDRTNLYELGNGIGLGALLVLFLFFFTQFLIKPSQSLGVYCLLVLSVGLFVCQLTGYSFKYFWPQFGEFGIRFSSVIGGFTYIWYFLFASVLFNLRKNNLKLHRVIVFVAIACALLTSVGLFIDMSKVISLFAIFALPLPLVVAIWALKHRLPSSTIFILGSSLHFTSAYLFILTCVGFDLGAHRHIFAVAGLGQLVDICLFAGALIYQSKALREELNNNLKQRLEDAEQLVRLEKEKTQSLAKQQDYILQLAATTHDLKQPLASLKMALAVVSDSESKEAKKKMESTLNYTDQILRSLLDSCKEEYIDSVERVEISKLFSNIASRYEGLNTKKHISLRFKQTQNFVNCSPIVLNRLLDNLITNAVRHTSKGGILVTARKKTNGTLFQVWDTGSGIPEASLKKLTQPYTQEKIKNEEGFGLGLYIVKTLCANAGYIFDIRSQQGKGSRVSVFVPTIDC